MKTNPPNSLPPSQPKPTPEQELAQLRQQYSAVCEMLWETVRSMSPDSHEVAVSPHASDPLWELSFLRTESEDGSKPDPTGRIRICASTIPEITEQEKKRVVRYLRGTPVPMTDALRALELPHPPTYVELKIQNYIKWSPEKSYWDSVTPPNFMEKVSKYIWKQK